MQINMWPMALLHKPCPVMPFCVSCWGGDVEWHLRVFHVGQPGSGWPPAASSWFAGVHLYAPFSRSRPIIFSCIWGFLTGLFSIYTAQLSPSYHAEWQPSENDSDLKRERIAAILETGTRVHPRPLFGPKLALSQCERTLLLS